ncbi:MAG: B12-binding domain-containing radical SAM protein [Candidatus Woesearchaeota archaeon]|nr:B12-binding domain-containing radical SAM protein [Candidatus Woesearchaeota archaeon]MDP7458337.1 B12-binding domain-containing radical SAM protein [Candidatus Woesearchaeota archaeon]
MQNKLVYLVNAGNDPGFSSIPNDYSFPALGVLALGSFVKKKGYPYVICRDGGVMPQEAILEEIQKLKPGLVGVSVLATSYRNSLEIAKCAKDSGSYTIFGNDQAAQLNGEIITNRPYVDFVAVAEYGEQALLNTIVDLMLGDNPADGRLDIAGRMSNPLREDLRDYTIPYDFAKEKLISIFGTNNYKPQNRSTALDSFPIPNRTLYPEQHWQKYLENYLERFAHLHDEPVTGVTTINRARGCSRSKEETQCKHCDMFLEPTFSSPEIFWEEVKIANEQVNANVFYEVCDSFSSFPKYIEGLVRTKPDDLGFDPKLFVYAQALDIVRRPALIDQFKELGVFRVNIGLESGCDTTLKHMKGPHDSVEKNYKALIMLKEAGIHAYGSFVLGTEPETEDTLRETVDWVKMIITEGLVTEVEAQPILPLPNNYYGRILKKMGLWQVNGELDWPVNSDALSRAYINNCTSITYDHAETAAKQILEFANTRLKNYGAGVFKGMADSSKYSS